MKFNSNKEKGNTGLGIAIAYYSANGYTVSIPLNDTQDYDFIVDKDNILKKIQVKATSCKTKYNKYQVALKSCGGTKGGTYKTVVDTNIDEVFIVTDSFHGVAFSIIFENLRKISQMKRNSKYCIMVNRKETGDSL